jgi:hypothetical protein
MEGGMEGGKKVGGALYNQINKETKERNKMKK